MRRLAGPLRLAAATSALAGAAGVLVRWSIRDTTLVSAMLFYATPWPVLALLLGVPALVALRAGRRATAVALAIASAGCAGAAVRQNWGPVRCEIAPGAGAAEAGSGIETLFWNCEHGRFGWEAITAAIRSRDADLVGLVEAGRSGPDRAGFWRRHMPGYDVWLPGRGLVLLVRGRFESGRVHNLAGRGVMAAARVAVRGRPLLVCVVDIHSSPALDRSLPVNELARLLGSEGGREGRPRIVMGDFNTPLDSAWLAPLRAQFTPAFEQAGAGWGATWPGPLPVMTLDQIWVAEPARAACASVRFTLLSDHKQVLARIEVPGAPPAATARAGARELPGGG